MASLFSEPLSADHFVKTHQFTNTVHRDQYPSIDPASSKLSQQGKTIIITGASQGIGKAIALAFTKANASRIAIASRNAKKLEATKSEMLKINPRVEVLTLATDITSEESVNDLEKTIGSVFGSPNVLVNSAGLYSSTEIVGESKPEEWWADLEVNLKGGYLMSRAFLRLVGLDKEATIVNVNTWGMLEIGINSTGYSISKLALARLAEAIDCVYPKIFSMTYHPGMIPTDMAEGHPEVLPFCNDTVELASGTAVYLASPQARFLSGRYMSANWDVDELESKKEEILQKTLLKIGLRGYIGGVIESPPAIYTTTINYPAKVNMDYFIHEHLPLAMKHWAKYGLKGYEVTEFHAADGQKLQYQAMCILRWDNPGSVEKATQNPDAKIVLDDALNFTAVRGIYMNGAVKVMV